MIDVFKIVRKKFIVISFKNSKVDIPLFDQGHGYVFINI